MSKMSRILLYSHFNFVHMTTIKSKSLKNLNTLGNSIIRWELSIIFARPKDYNLNVLTMRIVRHIET